MLVVINKYRAKEEENKKHAKTFSNMLKKYIDGLAHRCGDIFCEYELTVSTLQNFSFNFLFNVQMLYNIM